MTDGTLRVEGARLRVADGPAPGAPLKPARAVAAAVLAPPAYHGGDIVFAVDPALVLSDGAPPREIAVDFDDGLGLRVVAPGEPVRVRYARTGTARAHGSPDARRRHRGVRALRLSRCRARGAAARRHAARDRQHPLAGRLWHRRRLRRARARARVHHEPRRRGRGLRPRQLDELGRALRAARPAEPARDPARRRLRRRRAQLHRRHGRRPAERVRRRGADPAGAGRDRAAGDARAGRRQHGRTLLALRAGLHGVARPAPPRAHLDLVRRPAARRRHPAGAAVLDPVLRRPVHRGRRLPRSAQPPRRTADASLPPDRPAGRDRRRRIRCAAR